MLGIQNFIVPPKATLELRDVRGEGKVRLLFAERGIAACRVERGGIEVPIKSECMPQDLRAIKSLAVFQAYVKNAYAKTVIQNNGDLSLAICQRLLGGAPPTEAEQQMQAVKTMDMIAEGQQEIAKHAMMPDRILLVGRTKSGKSTLIQWTRAN